MPASAEGTYSSSPSPMVVAGQALGLRSFGLCWAVYGTDFPGGSGCSFKWPEVMPMMSTTTTQLATD